MADATGAATSDGTILGKEAKLIEPDAQPADAEAPETGDEATASDGSGGEGGETEAGQFPGGYNPEDAFKIDEPAKDDHDIEDEDLKGASPRAQQRIRALVGQRKEAQAAAQRAAEEARAVRENYARLEAQSRAYAQQNIQMREQMAAFRAEMNAIKTYGMPKKERSEVENFQDETVRRAREEFESQHNPLVKGLQSKVAELEKHLVEGRRQAESANRIRRYNGEADGAVDRHLIPEGFPEDMKSTLHRPLGNMVLAYAVGRRCSIEDAAKMLNKDLRSYGLGLQRAHAATHGKKIQQSNNVTPASPPGPASRRGKSLPTKEQVRKSGAKDVLDALMTRDGLIGG